MAIKSTLNHFGIHVSDKQKSFSFYKDLLTYLGYEVAKEDENHLGMKNGLTDIWLRETPEAYKKNIYHRKNTGVNHIAFGVSSKEDVDRFYREFLVPRGIKSLYSTPRPLPQYTPNYYAVYFEDPDRMKLEVVFL